jgi:[ribosomal protein S5]-alanine N-acetyltransferase
MAPFDGSNPPGEAGSAESPAHRDGREKQAAFMRTFPIETDRLLIREIEPGDVDAFQDLVGHPEFHYYYFDGSREKTQAFVDEAVAARKAPLKGELRASFMMAVEHKHTGALIGHVTVDLLDKAPDDYDLAYFVHPGHWGHGYATEAAAGFLKALFDTVAPPRIVATAHPDNIASQRLLRHVGFRETGETTRIDSADGQGERLWFRLDPQNFRGA